jgi:hypothetical protein
MRDNPMNREEYLEAKRQLYVLASMLEKSHFTKRRRRQRGVFTPFDLAAARIEAKLIIAEIKWS